MSILTGMFGQPEALAATARLRRHAVGDEPHEIDGSDDRRAPLDTVAARLRILETLEGGEQSTAQLAEACGARQDSMARLLRQMRARGEVRQVRPAQNGVMHASAIWASGPVVATVERSRPRPAQVSLLPLLSVGGPLHDAAGGE